MIRHSHPARRLWILFCFWPPPTFFIAVDVRIQRVSAGFMVAINDSDRQSASFRKTALVSLVSGLPTGAKLMRTSVRCRRAVITTVSYSRTIWTNSKPNLCPPFCHPSHQECILNVHLSTRDSWTGKKPINSLISLMNRSHSSHPRVWWRFVLAYFSSYQLTTFYSFLKSSEISRTAKFMSSPLVQALTSSRPVRVRMILFFLHSPCSHSLSSPTS